MAPVLPYDTLCLLLARGPRLLEGIARTQELFPTIHVPSLQPELVNANQVAWVGNASRTGPKSSLVDLRLRLGLGLGLGLSLKLVLLRVRIKFGEIAGRGVCRLLWVGAAGIWVAGWDGVLLWQMLWEPGCWLESADASGLGTHLTVRMQSDRGAYAHVRRTYPCAGYWGDANWF